MKECAICLERLSTNHILCLDCAFRYNSKESGNTQQLQRPQQQQDLDEASFVLVAVEAAVLIAAVFIVVIAMICLSVTFFRYVTKFKDYGLPRS